MAQKVYRREGEAAYQGAKGENDQNQVAQLYVYRNYLTTGFNFEDRFWSYEVGRGVHFLKQLDRHLQNGRLLS